MLFRQLEEGALVNWPVVDGECIIVSICWCSKRGHRSDWINVTSCRANRVGRLLEGSLREVAKRPL